MPIKDTLRDKNLLPHDLSPPLPRRNFGELRAGYRPDDEHDMGGNGNGNPESGDGFPFSPDLKKIDQELNRRLDLKDLAKNLGDLTWGEMQVVATFIASKLSPPDAKDGKLDEYRVAGALNEWQKNFKKEGTAGGE